MALLVSLAGLGVAGVGLFGVVAPRRLVGILARWRLLTELPMTVALRVGFGTLFVLAASSCRLPELVRAVGVVELGGAVALVALGAGRLRRFVEWWLERPVSFVRYWCLTAFGFGIVLAYAGVPYGWP